MFEDLPTICLMTFLILLVGPIVYLIVAVLWAWKVDGRLWETNELVQTFVGMSGKVIKTIHSDSMVDNKRSGRVRMRPGGDSIALGVQGVKGGMEEMRAISDSNIAVGVTIEVVSSEGVTLTVKPKELKSKD